MPNNKDVSKKITAFFANDTFYSSASINNEKTLQKEAENKALTLFQEASIRIPAYKNFLKKHSVKSEAIKSIQEFSKIPLMTKENYIEKYSISDRSWDGDLSQMSMISTSSGTTGKPHFWPRDITSEIEGALAHEFFLKEFCDIKTRKTLFVNGFAMGNWIAGTFTQSCIELLSWKGYSISQMTPGYSLEAVCEVIESMKDNFDQMIVCGHTPFLKEVVEELEARKFEWKKQKVLLLGTGQAITESWRDYISNIIHANSDFPSVVNLYGSADAALMGFETPQSIFLRSHLSHYSKNLELFFNINRLPSLYNYDPRLTYFELEKDELVITKNSGCPLIRYNIHDQGGIISSSSMNIIIQKEKIEVAYKSQSSLPYVFLFGRDKFMVKLYGANIYSEHTQHALSHNTLQKYITGRYTIEVVDDKDNNPKLLIRLETKQNNNPFGGLAALVQEIFVREVSFLNKEYAYLINQFGEKVKPEIVTHHYGDSKYFPIGRVKKGA